MFQYLSIFLYLFNNADIINSVYFHKNIHCDPFIKKHPREMFLMRGHNIHFYAEIMIHVQKKGNYHPKSSVGN